MLCEILTQKNLAYFDKSLRETCQRLEDKDFKRACEKAIEKEYGCDISAILPKQILERRKVRE